MANTNIRLEPGDCGPFLMKLMGETIGTMNVRRDSGGNICLEIKTVDDRLQFNQTDGRQLPKPCGKLR